MLDHAVQTDQATIRADLRRASNDRDADGRACGAAAPGRRSRRRSRATPPRCEEFFAAEQATEHDIAFHAAIAVASETRCSCHRRIVRRHHPPDLADRRTADAPMISVSASIASHSTHRRRDRRARRVCGGGRDGGAFRRFRQGVARRGRDLNASLMKITALETIRIAEFPNLLWLKVYTSEGIVGLGKRSSSRRRSRPTSMRPLRRSSSGAIRFRSTGSRKISWVTLASARPARKCARLRRWNRARGDPSGKATGQRIAELLGGFSRDKVRTCDTWRRVRRTCGKISGQSTANRGLARNERQYDDLNGFLERADELAEDLLSDGITAMKIWPFDFVGRS